MTIRNRTENGMDGLTRAAGVAGAAGLAAAGVLHLCWAGGSTWPAADADDLADLVVGRVPSGGERGAATAGDAPPMPGAAATVAVAALLGAAAALTAGASGVLPLPEGGARRLARLGARVASGVLLARGASGLLGPSLWMDQPSPRFLRWNRRLYSPLCLGLGGLVAVSSRAR